MAKSFIAMGKAAGYDMTSQDGLNQFMVAYNSGLTVQDDEPGSRHLPAPARVEATPTIRRQTPRLGRNEPCHCGSGKKYKKCCLRKDE